MTDTTLLYINLIAAIVCCKWAGDLGMSQVRQLLWGIAGLVAAPLVLLMLYVRLIRAAQVPASQKLAGASEF
jgi:hypothetical protein